MEECEKENNALKTRIASQVQQLQEQRSQITRQNEQITRLWRLVETGQGSRGVRPRVRVTVPTVRPTIGIWSIWNRWSTDDDTLNPV